MFDSGDADGTLQPTGRGPVPMPWLPRPEPLYPVMMMQNGAPFAGDARAALVAVLDRLATHGLAPHCATEMEFTLLDGDTDGAAHRSAARDPVSGRPQRHADICSPTTLIASLPFSMISMTGPRPWAFRPNPRSRRRASGSLK